METDVGDVVLGAAVGAPAHLDVHFAYERVVLLVDYFDGISDRPGETHGRGDAELAAIGAGAGDDVGDFKRTGVAESDVVELLPDFVQGGLWDPAHREVLLVG